jgi:hypothetical protein
LAVSLFTLPWTTAGASPVLAYNVTWLAAWMLNGLTTFCLLKRFVRDSSAAFIGSLAFVCSFYVMLHGHGHLHLIWLWPMPLSMLLLERWFDNPRWRRLGAWTLVFLVGALTSWYVAVMMLLVNGLTGGTLVLVGRYNRKHGALSPVGQAPAIVRFAHGPTGTAVWTRRSGQLVCAGIVVTAVLFPFARHYVGMRGAAEETVANSASVASYLVPPQNTLSGRWWMAHVHQQPGSIWGEQSLFAGWLALALAAVGMFGIIQGRDLPRRARYSRRWRSPNCSCRLVPRRRFSVA